MKNGNWIPISKALSKHLPLDRPYSKVEAAYSIQLDYDENNGVSVSGYSALWDWSRNKVRAFLKEMCIEISYQNSKFSPNKKGQVKGQVVDSLGTGKGQVRLIDNKDLLAKPNSLGTASGQVKDRLKDTTINTNTKKNKKTFLSDSTEIRLSNMLFSLIRKNNPTAKEPNFQGWAKSIDLMLRVDSRPIYEIEKIIQWCQVDDFWYKNILSTSKLREKYDQLLVKMKSNGRQPDIKPRTYAQAQDAEMRQMARLVLGKGEFADDEPKSHNQSIGKNESFLDTEKKW